MKPHPFATICRVLFLLFLLSALSALPAHAAACGAGTGQTPVPATDATAYAATSPNLVAVIDATTNSLVCTIPVGTTPTSNPGNLAASPDSKYLFVENDAEGSVTVVDLNSGSSIQTIALTGVSTPMTANLAVSPDNSKVYVVTLPAALTPTTQASLWVISVSSLTVTAGPISVVAPAPATATPVTGPGLGVGFSWDSTTAMIATEGLSYVVNTSTNTISSTLPVSGGGVAVDQSLFASHSYAYVIDVSSQSGGSAISEVDLASASVVATTTSSGPMCTQANALATPSPVLSGGVAQALAFYSCNSNGDIESVNFSSTPTPTNPDVVNVSTTAHPQGLFIASDNSKAYVALDDGTIAIVSSPTANPTLGTPINLGAPARGIVQRPVLVSAISPSTANVPTGTTKQLTSTVSYAFSAGLIPTWAVNGVTGGNLSTTGSISNAVGTAGLFTAPQALPTARTETISATSPEIPPLTPATLYPVTATVTLTPSQLVIQQPINGGLPITAGTPFPVSVSLEDAAGNLDTNNSDSVSITVIDTPSNPSPTAPPAQALQGGTPVPTVNGVATFLLTLTSANAITGTGLATSTAQYSYTLTAASGSLTSLPSGSFVIQPAANNNALFFTTQPASPAGTAGTPLTAPVVVAVEDQFSNVVTSSTVSVTLTASATGVPPVVGNPLPVSQGFAIFTNSNDLTLTKANQPPASGSTQVNFYNYSLLASGTPPLAPITSNSTFTINATNGVALAFTTQPANGSTAGIAGAALNLLPGSVAPIIVAVEDQFANVATQSNASITITPTSTPGGQSLAAGSANPVPAAAGIASFGNLIFDGANTITGATTTTPYSYTLVATSAPLTATPTSNSFLIQPAAAAKLVFTTEPASGSPAGTAGSPLTPTFIVAVEDTFGNVETSPQIGSLAPITLTSAPSPGTGTVTSTLPITAAGGFATFTSANNVTLTAANMPPASGSITPTGYSYMLKATSTAPTLGPTSSNSFVISPAAGSKLVFTTEPPATSQLGGNTRPFPVGGPPVVVCVEDPFGNVATTSTGNSAPVTLSLSVPTNLITGALTFPAAEVQTQPVSTASTGVAVFSITPTSGTLNNSIYINKTLPNGQSYTVTASASPNGAQTTTTSTAFTLSSNSSITASFQSPVFTGENSQLTPAPAPTAFTNPFSAGGSLIITVNNDPNETPTPLGVTWTSTFGSVAVGTCAYPTGATVFTSYSCTATENPAAPPNTTGTNVTLTATSVSDLNRTFADPINLFPDLWLPSIGSPIFPGTSTDPGLQPFPATLPSGTPCPSAAVGSDPVGFSCVLIPPTTSSGTYYVALLGSTTGSSFTFTCSNFSSGLTQAVCAFTNAGSSGIVTNANNGTTATVSPSATTTFVAVSLGITRSSTAPSSPSTFRFGPVGGPTGATSPWFGAGLLFSIACVGLAGAGLFGQPFARGRHSFALVFLIILVLGWATACAQFSQPPFPSAPSTGGTTGSAGSFILTITPTGPNAPNFTTISIPISVTVN